MVPELPVFMHIRLGCIVTEWVREICVLIYIISYYIKILCKFYSIQNIFEKINLKNMLIYVYASHVSHYVLYRVVF